MNVVFLIPKKDDVFFFIKKHCTQRSQFYCIGMIISILYSYSSIIVFYFVRFLSILFALFGSPIESMRTLQCVCLIVFVECLCVYILCELSMDNGNEHNSLSLMLNCYKQSLLCDFVCVCVFCIDFITHPLHASCAFCESI